MNADELKQLSIEGCELIGRGAHASVYRIAPDEIVKVYREDIPYERVLTEKRRAKRAFILGVPTAISFDIVKVENAYHIWKRTLSLYYDGMSREELAGIEYKARILGLIRILDFVQRSVPPDLRDMLTGQSISMLNELIWSGTEV
ncbi:MAG: hypothetical protein IKE53_01490 [Clostridiales bacterium]|nr:hypothetical protein [Clostridiales bacterium]